jgi:hypothetical protein
MSPTSANSKALLDPYHGSDTLKRRTVRKHADVSPRARAHRGRPYSGTAHLDYGTFIVDCFLPLLERRFAG